MEIEVKFYDRTTIQGCSDSCAEHVVSLARLSLAPHESLASETTEHGEDGNTSTSTYTHTLVWVGWIAEASWGTYSYPGVLSDTPTECVTQCATVPSLKQNTRHHANHALSRICAWNLRATLFHNNTINQRRVCLHWRLLVTAMYGLLYTPPVDTLLLFYLVCIIILFVC